MALPSLPHRLCSRTAVDAASRTRRTRVEKRHWRTRRAGRGPARHSARLAKRRRRTRRAQTGAATKRLPSDSSVCMRYSRRSGRRGDAEHDHRASGNSAAARQVHVHLNLDTKTQQQPKPISLLLAALLSFSHVLMFLLVLSFSNFFTED